MDGTLAFSFAAEVEQDEVSERAFIPWRLPASALAQDLIDEVIDSVLMLEKQRGLRRRQRKAVDLERFRQAISAIICDAAVTLLTEANRPLYLSRSHQDLGSGSRYIVPTSTRKLPQILDLLASQELAILVQRIGGGWEDGFRGRTTISAGKGLIERVSSLGLGPEDFRVRPDLPPQNRAIQKESLFS